MDHVLSQYTRTVKIVFNILKLVQEMPQSRGPYSLKKLQMVEVKYKHTSYFAWVRWESRTLNISPWACVNSIGDLYDPTWVVSTDSTGTAAKAIFKWNRVRSWALHKTFEEEQDIRWFPALSVCNLLQHYLLPKRFEQLHLCFWTRIRPEISFSVALLGRINKNLGLLNAHQGNTPAAKDSHNKS